MLKQSQREQLLPLVTGFSGSHECHQVMKLFARGVDDTALLHLMPSFLCSEALQ